MRSKIFSKEFTITMGLLEIPVSGWTCLNTLYIYVDRIAFLLLSRFLLAVSAVLDLTLPALFSLFRAAATLGASNAYRVSVELFEFGYRPFSLAKVAPMIFITGTSIGSICMRIKIAPEPLSLVVMLPRK